MIRPAFEPPELEDDDYSEGDRLIELVEAVYQTPEGGLIKLDDWQKYLIRRVLAKRPDGSFRFQTNVISVGRQCGKSVLGACMALYGLLLHCRGPAVVSIASTSDQATIIYNRLRYVINQNPALKKLFLKSTETRGMKLLDDSGYYKVLPSTAKATQGQVASMLIADELHHMSPDVFNAMLIGTGQRENSLIIGVTTAGNDDSILLKTLYESGKQGKIGLYVWEADEDAQLDGDDVEEQLMKANPALEAGRMKMSTALNEMAVLPPVDQMRYRFNRFVDGAELPWVEFDKWLKTRGEGIPTDSEGVTFAVDRSPDWRYAAISAVYNSGDKIYTELVASLVEPDLDGLIDMCVKLQQNHSPISWAVDGTMLAVLGKAMRDRGFKVYILSQNEMNNACAMTYAKIVQGKLITKHTDDLLHYQAPRASKKTFGEGWRLDRKSKDGIDAINATIMGIYVSEIDKNNSLQVF